MSLRSQGSNSEESIFIAGGWIQASYNGGDCLDGENCGDEGPRASSKYRNGSHE